MIPKYKTDPPQGGRSWGFNRWAFTRAMHLLKDGHSEEEILEAFLANEKLTSVARPGELERQVSQAALRFDPNKPYTPKPKIEYDVNLAFPIIKDSAGALERLREASPAREATPEQVIDALFPDPETWICCGVDKELPNQAKKYIAHCFQKPFWMEENRLSRMAYLVPNPMKGKESTNLDGRPSIRCLNNVKERRFIIYEGDTINKVEQAAMILYLSKFAKLAVVTDSGSKSLHGYFATSGVDEETATKFFDLCIRLGADPVHRNASQFARMPGGLRNKTTPQRMIYFNPDFAA
jgi:hypothetical protein